MIRGGKRSWALRNKYKGLMGKTKGREVGMAGVDGEWWGLSADNST